MPVNQSFGIDHDLVSHRAEPIACLGVLVAVSHNPLAALLELHELVAQSLHRCHSVGSEHASLDVDTLDILVVLGLIHSLEHLVKSDGCHLASREESEDVILGALLHLS